MSKQRQSRELQYVQLLKQARSFARDICENIEGNERLSWDISRQVLTEEMESHGYPKFTT